MKRIFILCLTVILFLAVLSGCDIKAKLKSLYYTQDITNKNELVSVTSSSGEDILVKRYDDVNKSKLSAEDFNKDENGRVIYTGSDYDVYTGIDISEYQEDCDFEAVKADGIDFVILRCGFRGYGAEGHVRADSAFEKSFSAAKEAGLKVGVYFYSQATTTQEAYYEAVFVNDLLDGKTLDLPVFFDWEDTSSEVEGSRVAGMSGASVTDCALMFCQTIEGLGYKAGVYHYEDIGYYFYDLAKLTSFCVWHSQPGDFPAFYYAFDLWQYTYGGTVDGVDGNVDLNLWFIEKEADDGQG